MVVSTIREMPEDYSSHQIKAVSRVLCIYIYRYTYIDLFAITSFTNIAIWGTTIFGPMKQCCPKSPSKFSSVRRVRCQDAIIAESQVAFRSINQFAGVAVEHLVHHSVSHGQSFGVRHVRNDIVRDTIGREAVPWASDNVACRSTTDIWDPKETWGSMFIDVRYLSKGFWLVV